MTIPSSFKTVASGACLADFDSLLNGCQDIEVALDAIRFEPVTRDNWEDALKLEVLPEQRPFTPSVAESLAAAYVKPWDEALDPYLIYAGRLLVGAFYLSYTPRSADNYWIGGFQIDRRHQGKGVGTAAFRRILAFIPEIHPDCRTVRLTVEPENAAARHLYAKLGFGDTGERNKYDEIIYTLDIA